MATEDIADAVVDDEEWRLFLMDIGAIPGLGYIQPILY